MWQEAARAYLEPLFQHLLKGAEENHEKKYNLVDVPTEI
jgi:hypothetical protein